MPPSPTPPVLAPPATVPVWTADDDDEPRWPQPPTERELHVVLPETWIDTSHVLQLAHAQAWDVVDVRMQPAAAVLVFGSAQAAARAFAQVNGSPEGVVWPVAGARVQAHWAGAVGRANDEEAHRPPASAPKQLEFSIFVGDLAPETTNADLVAVFRNPLLGLRADREPRVIRPFTSCRSAKIMVNPETGISKGYGFVRFTDEADQQRALIEMQGLYCLSRPMRLSHATAKSKAGQAAPAPSNGNYASLEDLDSYILTRAGAHLLTNQPYPDPYPRHSADSFSQSMPRSRSADAEDLFGSLGEGRVLGVEGGRVLGMEGSRALNSAFGPDVSRSGAGLSEGARLESARALLGVLNSADPYNTTVFVGGLSGLIAEETLRGFFAPFGDIHYVKIPPGKGCGFVQFVRKADAERAIERMQGFPIGGSKIRLSWGRSQSDKAAQAAAQAAQLGLNLGGLHLNSLSAADSARLFQALDALGYSSIPGGAKSGGGFQAQRGFDQPGNGYPSLPSGPPSGPNYQPSGTTYSPFYDSLGQTFQGGFQMSQPFSPTLSFDTSPSPDPMSPIAKPQAPMFGQQYAQSSLYEPSSAGLSRAYTTAGSSFQPFSDPLFGRVASRSAVGSTPMGQSASATGHLGQPFTRRSLAFEPDAFDLPLRERQLTAPAATPNVKNLNLGLAGMNLSQRREFGIDSGPLSAPLGPRTPTTTTTNGNNCHGNGGVKPPSDNSVYIH